MLCVCAFALTLKVPLLFLPPWCQGHRLTSCPLSPGSEPLPPSKTKSPAAVLSRSTAQLWSVTHLELHTALKPPTDSKQWDCSGDLVQTALRMSAPFSKLSVGCSLYTLTTTNYKYSTCQYLEHQAAPEQRLWQLKSLWPAKQTSELSVIQMFGERQNQHTQ